VCPSWIQDPLQCCKCGQGSLSAGLAVQIDARLTSAVWGACDCCSLLAVRTEEATWPDHIVAFVVCGEEVTKIDFAYDYLDDILGWFTVGQHVDVMPQMYDVQFKNRPDPVVRRSEITRQSAEAIIAKAEADSADPPDYNFIQDCHWYVAGLFLLGEPCDTNEFPHAGL
jgi:hypothetical protein